jgi:hypothetical protein
MTRDDLADEEMSVTILSASGKTVVLSGIRDVQAGDRITQGALTTVVTAASDDGVNTTCTTLWTEVFAAGAATWWPATAYTWTFNPATGGHPSQWKQWREASFLFQENETHVGSVSFESEISPGTTNNQLTFPLNDGAFGDSPFGNPSAKVIRVSPVPQGKSRSAQLTVSFTVREALSAFRFEGMVLEFEPGSEANSK